MPHIIGYLAYAVRLNTLRRSIEAAIVNDDYDSAIRYATRAITVHSNLIAFASK